MSSLPKSLVSLTKLKTLCLDQCTLKHIVGIGALINLEILSFLDSSIEEFPSEIGQLAHLKMLDLSNSRIEMIPPNTLSKLTKIEELYMGNASIKWEEESSTKQNKSASIAELGFLTSLTTLEIQICEAWILSMDMMFDKLERYNVVIGDKWKWSSNKRTSRLLKLKLGSSIHLEPGIKAMIKRVEDLYLDKVNGISDVLLDLKGEGFPLLKHLHIQNNGQVQHIINTMKRNGTHDLFPELEKLILHNLNNLVKICHGPLPINSFRKLTVIEVKNCDQLIYLFSVLMVKALSQLVEIQVSKCSSMKRIVYIENVDSSITTDDKIEFYSLRSLSLCHLPVIHDFYSNEFTSCMTATSLFNGIKVSFSSLETLKLSSINLEKIWDDDDDLSGANCIHNLAKLIVEDCRGLKYLFSTSLFGSLLKLKHLEISKCEMMEEIIAPMEENSVALEEVRFSKLETMLIKDMKSLKKVWHSQFESLKNLKVSNCGKLVNIFPSDMQRTFGSLETLKVSDCGSVEEIFELASKEIHIEDETMTQVSQLKKLHLLGLPKLKQIWSREAQANLRFCNLQLMCVEFCENLEYLFPFSIAIQAIQLESVTVRYARSMKQIVSDKEGLMDSPVKFEFNHLISLVLWSLFELEGFFVGNHSVLCPSLWKLDIRQCGKLKIFKTQSTSGGRERVFDSKLQISMPHPLFTLEELICNLEWLALHSEDANMILQRQFSRKHFSKLKFLCLANFEDEATFPYWFLQNITSLEHVVIECSYFNEIFQEEIHMDEKRKFDIRTQIKKLNLSQLYDLQHICKEGFQIDPILEVLECLWVDHCSNLKHLLPSSVTFCHLTDLEVDGCNGLIHLVTLSTARSLVKLTTMKITNCNSLEQVVVEEREGSEDEIAFSSLEILELDYLPMIKRFCSCNCFLNFPLLQEVVVKQCPRMNIFSVRDTSTPKLQKISWKEEDGKVYWEGDLNKTINKMFVDMVAFSSFSHLEFSEYPELEELWYGQVGQKIFNNLKNLVVRKCTFLSNMIFSSHLLQLLYTLEELEVAECDSLEVIFDVKALDDKAMESKEVSGLKKLTLSSLPNLKQIWNRETGEIISFRNLQMVRVDECPNLKYLFSPSLCQDLMQLEELDIRFCGVEQIVVNEEGFKELKFYFPLLRIFRLIHLMQLNDFYSKRYTLECPLLKVLNVGRCEALQIFAFGHLDSQQLRGVCVDLPIQQALFHIEKVSENLEELSLNEKDAMRILNGNYEKKLFQRTEMLRLQYFQETPIKFLNELLERFPDATTFQARWSSFETFFPATEISYLSIKKATQIKKLWLFQLEQLEHIWNDNTPSDALIPNLEHLVILDCSRLIRLATPLTSFISLTSLDVKDCNGLMYLMTSFTAKSLVHLTSLTVTNCRMLEEVVMTNEGESEEEIIFKSLKYMELTCLSSFKSFCFRKHTFIFPSLVALKVIGCQKMQNFSSGITVAPFMKLVEVENGKKHWKGDLNTTIKHLFIAKAIREGDEGNYEESSSDIMKSSQTYQMTASTIEASSFEEQVGQSKPNQIVDTGKQETHQLPSESDDREQNEQALSSIEKPLAQVTQNASSPSTNQDIDSQDSQEDSQDSKTQSSKNLFKQATTVNNKESLTKGTREMGENIERPFVEATKIALSPTRVYDAEVNEPIEKPLIQTTQEAQRPAAVQDIEGSHESKTSPRENLFNQPKTFVTIDKKETIGTQEIHDTMDKRLIQTDQDPKKLATTQKTEEEPCDDSYIGTQKICGNIKKPSVPAVQNVPNSTMVAEAATDPSPSQAPKPMISSPHKSNIYRNYKGMVDILEQNMPYLEAGVNRHPQVLDWLNTKRPRVFASSFFSLFAEVTRILRTTRKVDLTEDGRNYIRECCVALQGVGFDESWISYVHGCIEECGDGENIKREIEEAEAQLESINKSLVLLRDKANRLHDFIES